MPNISFYNLSKNVLENDISKFIDLKLKKANKQKQKKYKYLHVCMY